MPVNERTRQSVLAIVVSSIKVNALSGLHQPSSGYFLSINSQSIFKHGSHAVTSCAPRLL